MKNKNYSKFIFSILLGLSLIWTGCGGGKSNTQTDDKKNAPAKKSAAMVIPVTIDAFDKLRDGAKSVLDPLGVELKVFSAEGDPAKFETAIKSSLLTKPNYLVTVGTQVTNTAFGPQFKGELPTVLATAISEPSLVESLVQVGLEPPRNSKVAIISDTPKEDIFELLAKSLKEFKPNVKQVGIIYNLSEINSKSTAESSIKAIETNGISVTKGIISNADDISKITTDLLLKGAEVIVIPLDKYAVEKAATITQLSKSKNVPVFSLDDGTVTKSGVMVAVSVNYRLIGEEAGKAIAEIEQGKATAEQMPVIRLDKASVYFNESVAKSFGINLPETLKSSAVIIKDAQ
jgi:putative ABC transport system substrate-binding protein